MDYYSFIPWIIKEKYLAEKSIKPEKIPAPFTRTLQAWSLSKYTVLLTAHLNHSYQHISICKEKGNLIFFKYYTEARILMNK